PQGARRPDPELHRHRFALRGAAATGGAPGRGRPGAGGDGRPGAGRVGPLSPLRGSRNGTLAAASTAVHAGPIHSTASAKQQRGSRMAARFPAVVLCGLLVLAGWDRQEPTARPASSALPVTTTVVQPR